MIDAVQIAASGMQAQQQNVEVIANNLANVNTPGFKRARVSFVELMSRSAASDAQDGSLPSTLGPARAVGVLTGKLQHLFDSGDARKTDSPMDLTIQGDGWIEVKTTDGSRAFTRGGTLSVTPDGMLATASGHVLKPDISIPSDMKAMVITPDGRVMATTSRRAKPIELGQLELTRFVAADGLEPLGEGIYRATEAAGEPIAGRAGQDGMGSLRQGYLEGSNVKLVEEMMGLMVAQRAYEANVKVIQASDEMLGMVNSLRK